MVIQRRVTQEPIEVAEQASAAARRLTQDVVEVGEKASAAQRRVTQLLIEVPRSPVVITTRVTQEPIEVGGRATGGAFSRRLTQIAVEVGYIQPADVFVDPSALFEEPWSPAYLQPPVESEASIYSGVVHGLHIVLGALGVRFGRG